MNTKKLQEIIAGALFDFCGHLTIQEVPLILSITHEATPLLRQLEKWSSSRGLPLEPADVHSWHKDL